MITRRQFLKYSAIAGAATVVPWKIAVREAMAQYGVNSPALQKFVDLIRDVGTGVPVATPDSAVAPVTGVQHYTIDVIQFFDTLHSLMPGGSGGAPAQTRLWGFNPAPNGLPNPSPAHLGGVIVAVKGTPLQITFRNNLPSAHIIPVDTTIPDGANANNRVSIHLHGGFVPWISDGGPFDWWAPTGAQGPSFLNNAVLNPGAALNEGEYYYPNDQSARLVWYHDHAFGITRINAYAGIASAYVLYDPVAEAVLTGQNIPSAVDLTSTKYLVFQDKIFVPPAGAPAGYPVAVNPGDLFYPYIYDPALFGPAGLPSFPPPATPLTPFPAPSVVPEMFGDTILVNGTAYPVLEVQQMRYRFVMLNACNSRFLNPRLVRTAGLVFPDNAEPAKNAAGPSFIQIASEGGYLPGAVPVNGPKQLQLLLAPAERADLIVDFTGIPVGTEFILYNDAAGPFPGGAAIFDYYPQNPKTPVSTPGFGPNTRTLLKVRVVAGAVGSPALPPVITLPFGPAYGNAPLVTQTAGVPTPIPANVTVGAATYPVSTVRQLTLNEGFDDYGRLAQYLGTNVATGPGFFGREYLDASTEVIPAGSVEVWEIYNLTADSHPIHFHLVNVQILSRQKFSVRTYNGTAQLIGRPFAPDANELGWKETVRMNPGEVTRVIMKFDLPAVPFTVPVSPRTGGNEYVWHCHILEHEEHDMMRPLVVV